jgi:hypothetical protein
LTHHHAPEKQSTNSQDQERSLLARLALAKFLLLVAAAQVADQESQQLVVVEGVQVDTFTQHQHFLLQEATQ